MYSSSILANRPDPPTEDEGRRTKDDDDEDEGEGDRDMTLNRYGVTVRITLIS